MCSSDLTLGIPALIGASTPGFASEIDRSLNAPVSFPVPQTAILQAAPQPAAADTVGTVTGDDTATTPENSYSSLADAVAAQDTAAREGDLSCMAGAIYYEAKGEPLAGQLAVADVIINRTKSGRFPKSICSVVLQRGQFSFVRGGRIPAIASNAAYRTAVAIARVAMADAWNSPAPEAMYFHARHVSPGWRMTKIASIGNHVFYR